MAKDKEWTKCPSCKLNLWPDGRCHNCIPASFRAETARAFMLALWSSPNDDGKDFAFMAVAAADALIAELTKENP